MSNLRLAEIFSSFDLSIKNLVNFVKIVNTVQKQTKTFFLNSSTNTFNRRGHRVCSLAPGLFFLFLFMVVKACSDNNKLDLLILANRFMMMPKIAENGVNWPYLETHTNLKRQYFYKCILSDTHSWAQMERSILFIRLLCSCKSRGSKPKLGQNLFYLLVLPIFARFLAVPPLSYDPFSSTHLEPDKVHRKWSLYFL